MQSHTYQPTAQENTTSDMQTRTGNVYQQQLCGIPMHSLATLSQKEWMEHLTLSHAFAMQLIWLGMPLLGWS